MTSDDVETSYFRVNLYFKKWLTNVFFAFQFPAVFYWYNKPQLLNQPHCAYNFDYFIKRNPSSAEATYRL